MSLKICPKCRTIYDSNRQFCKNPKCDSVTILEEHTIKIPIVRVPVTFELTKDQVELFRDEFRKTKIKDIRVQVVIDEMMYWLDRQ